MMTNPFYYTAQVTEIKNKIRDAEINLKVLYMKLHAAEEREYDAYIQMQNEEAEASNQSFHLADYSDEAITELSMKPLTMLTDGGRLEELEKRFPGAKFVLTTKDRQYEITYKHNIRYGNIYCENAHISAPFFDSFGTFANGKPQLMAEWHGLYIDLSHLF